MRLSDLAGQHVGIWGFGREGRAALGALPQDCSVLVVSDSEPDLAATTELDAKGIPHLNGAAGHEALLSCDVVIRSPGVSVYRPEFSALHEAAVPTTTGTNLWFAENPDAFTMAVTGTKGKSTTSSLLAHLLSAQGKTAELAGNIGRPLLDLLGTSADVYVFELSAQQIADLEYSPNVAVFTNLYREHLDWHLTEENYINDKLNLLRHRPGMTAVLNAADPRQREGAPGALTIAWYGDENGFHLEDDWVVKGKQLYASADVSLRGRHNLLNICAALTALECAGADPYACGEALRSFVPLRHRLEDIAVVGEVTYCNDSISTTPKASIAALEAFAGKPITLLLGGYERNQDYSELRTAIANGAVHAVLTLPDNGERIFEEIRDVAGPTIEKTTDLKAAVARAAEITPAGGVVLLSPAAPSFGHFTNFEERGDVFAATVHAMIRPDVRPNLA